jgi:peptidyl-prolyl cis-trans isomerase D
MAILERLRVRAGLLLAIVIGLALFAFILSDFLDSGGSLFNRSKYEIAEVSGKSIPYNDFDKKVKEFEDFQKLQSGQTSLDEETTDQIRNITWENLIQDMLLEKQFDKLGLDVSEDELKNIIMGDNPHPAIARYFTDQHTGVFNRQAFNTFMSRISSDEEMSDDKKFYLFIENEIYRQRKYVKYLNLVRNGLYATTFEANRQLKETSRSVDANFIVKNFSVISDSAISVTEKDLKKYYEEHKKLFEQIESRDLMYVYFEVTPSEADFKVSEKWINDIKSDFESAADPIQFVNMESDVPFDIKHYNAGELPDSLNNKLFNASIGTSYGPYYTKNSYRIARLASVTYQPDSVKARHILLRPAQNYEETKKTADSLANLIRKGADFAALAMLYSTDGSAQTGGDLGWFREGEMIAPFSDSCFHGHKGAVMVIQTQAGMHVVQILDQSKPTKQVQIATLVKNVLASEETDHNIYVKANEFAGKNNSFDKFVKAIETEKLNNNLQRAINVGPMDKQLNDLRLARPLVTWAYKAEEKDVSTVFKIDNKYIIATVEKAREKGPAPLNDIRADIENRVKQQKKAEILAEQFKTKKASAKTLEDLAREMNLAVEPVSGIKFASSSLGNAGVEPKIVAAATSLEKGTISDPIIGENGVYVLVVINITVPSEVEKENSVNLSKNYVERNYAARTNYFAYEAIKELAKIKDNRREFY